MSANKQQIEFWSGGGGDYWVDKQFEMDTMLNPLGQKAIDSLDIQKGDSILDVGCGTGTTTLLLSEKVGPEGKVTGLDISVPMLARTLELAIENNKTNISIINKDVQENELDDQYDHLFSRFGVMFFTDPISSFKNLKKSLKADGSFSFVCWQHPSKNPWHTKPIGILKKYFDLPPAQPRAPSPFAFEEKTYLEEILKSSGFSNYSIDDNLENIHLFPNKSSYDAAKDFMALNPIISNALQGMSDDEKEPIVTELAEVYESHKNSQGLEFESATWVVNASS